MNGADTTRRGFCDPSHMRTHAQSRSEIVSLRAPVPYMAGYGRMRIFVSDRTAQGCARLIPDSLPTRLRPPSLTIRSTPPVNRRSTSPEQSAAGLYERELPLPVTYTTHSGNAVSNPDTLAELASRQKDTPHTTAGNSHRLGSHPSYFLCSFRQHLLYFFPLPHGHCSFLPIFLPDLALAILLRRRSVSFAPQSC